MYRSQSVAAFVTLLTWMLPSPAWADDVAVKRQISELHRQTRSDSPAEVVDALIELTELGEPAKTTLRSALSAHIKSGRRPIERALKIADELRDKHDQLVEAREKATKHADNIAKPGLAEAKDNWNDLEAMTRSLASGFAQLQEAYSHFAVRETVLEMWAADFADDTSIDLEEERVFLLETEEKLDVSPIEVLEFLEGPRPDERVRHWVEGISDPLMAELAFQRMAREQLKFNGQVSAALMSRQETDNSEIVNRYRIALGRLPLELDPRVLQAARRHSREMVERKYFSHDSPVKENATVSKRLANAGYPASGGENIAAGNGSAETTFWQWFNSPDHHKNMIRDGYAALGVGKWGNTWTQNFGGAPRVMHLPIERQAELLEVKGEIVKPR